MDYHKYSNADNDKEKLAKLVEKYKKLLDEEDEELKKQSKHSL